MAAGPNLLSLLFAVSYLVSYVVLIAYAGTLYKRPTDFPLQLTTYTYAALLGIQILQNGQFMSSLGLGEWLVLFINAANLIAFANIVKFSDKMDQPTMAYAYLLAAVLFKLVAELALIVLFIDQVQPVQVLMALSVPLLGATLLVAYLSRRERRGKQD